MKRDEFFSSLRTNCLGEFKDSEDNEVCLFLDFNEEKQTIEVGYITNCGLSPEFEVEYDNYFSIDSNLENLLDRIYNNGFTDINEQEANKMKKEIIKNRLEKHGYKVVFSFSGNVVITNKQGFQKVFNSLNAAYKNYFK